MSGENQMNYIPINVSISELIDIIGKLGITRLNDQTYDAEYFMNMISRNEKTFGNTCIDKNYMSFIYNSLKNIIDVEEKWNNMIISGGFITHALYGAYSKIKTSDIDIFLYGTKEEQLNKYHTLLDHFSERDAYFCVRGNVTTIIIPSFDYDIQIISSDPNSTPLDIIKKFDYTYVQFYYDQSGVYGTLDAFKCLQSGYTKYTKDKFRLTQNSTNRLAKTLLKGFQINRCDVMKNVLSIVDVDEIQNSYVKNVPNKSKVIRCNYTDANDVMINIIRELYITDICTYKDVEKIKQGIKIGNCDDYYDNNDSCDMPHLLTIKNVTLSVIKSIDKYGVKKVLCTIPKKEITFENKRAIKKITTHINSFDSEFIEYAERNDLYVINTANVKINDSDVYSFLNRNIDHTFPDIISDEGLEIDYIIRHNSINVDLDGIICHDRCFKIKKIYY